VEGRGLVAVLSLVDLAGSESADKTGHTSGMRALEGAKINTSLFALSRVIEALSKSDGSKPPFRDSKLTHLLKPALESGASSKTALICCVNPAAAHASETQSTLQFARKARCVVTRPVVREDLSERDLMRRLAEKNEALQAALAAAASEATATATAEIAAQRAEADAEKKRHAEAEAAAVAETAAAQAETAAARTETAAAKAKTAALRDRLARVNAANLVGQLGVQDAEAGDARAKRAGRRATLAATAAAAAPAVDGSEANNALLSALAARHGPTKAALAAEVAARATTETALMSAEAALTAAEAELDAALRRNEQLTAELSFAAMFSAAEIARARAAAAQDIALAAAKVAAATEVADAARAGEAAAMATAAAAAASADFMDADAPLPYDFDDDVRDKENADCAVQQGSKPVSGKRSRGGDGAAGGARSLRVRKGAAGSDGVDQHGCIGVCRVGQAGPFQLRPATEPGAAEPPAAAAKRSRNQAAASKPSAAKQPRITAKEPCKAVPPTTRNRCHCKCDSTGCGGHLCPVNESTRRSRCGGEEPDHERCGGGLCPVNKSTRRNRCRSKGAGHKDCRGP
jgi:chemotaxis protein histidine kinase CheA